MEIPFHVPDIGETELAAVEQVLRSRWLTTGPRCQEFESAFAAYVGAPHAVSVSSGTAALHLALLAAGVGPGDEVITTPYTFVATVEVILYVGARPVFVDIDWRTLNIDPAAAASAVTPRTRAILPVHFGGYPAEIGALRALASEHGLRVIEDAAHALPAEFEGQRIGSGGHFTAFSFYATKNLCTGEGGMITTADGDAAERLRGLRLHGIRGDAWKRYARGGRWFYEVVEQGYKYNLTDIQAALGLAQLARLDRMMATRREHDRRYREALRDCPLVLPPEEDARHRSALHLFVVRLDPERTEWKRDALIEVLRGRGIHCSVHFIPVHLHPFYRAQGYRPGMYPNAERAYAQAITLPFYPAMTPQQLDYLLETLRELLRRGPSRD